MARYLAAYGVSLIAGAQVIAPQAGAEPPDLNRYTPVNVADYALPIPSGGAYPGAQSGVAFNTPAGQSCNMFINVRGMWAVASCFGPIPGGGPYRGHRGHHRGGQVHRLRFRGRAAPGRAGR